MVFHNAQKKIANDLHRFRVVNCGRRFGKTTLAVFEMLGKACAKDQNRVAYIANTYQQARDIAWEMLKLHSRPISIAINESRLEIRVQTQDGGSAQILLRGWESVDTLRGQRFDFIVLDEVASMRHFWIGWREVLRPTLTDTKGDALFISTPQGFNHFYDLFNLQDEDQDYQSFHFTSFDNPFIPKDEIEKARLELPEDEFAQEYLADFRKTKGLIYKEFDRLKHVFIFLPDTKFVNTLGAVDFGYTNPFALLIVLKDGDNNYYVREEQYETGKTDEEIARRCKSYEDVERWYADPEAPAAIEVMRRLHLRIKEVKKGKDSVRNGISKVRNLFKQKKLFIHKSCKNLLWELETYQYREPTIEGHERLREEPLKEGDHAVDALRYLIQTDFNALGSVLDSGYSHVELPSAPSLKGGKIEGILNPREQFIYPEEDNLDWRN